MQQRSNKDIVFSKISENEIEKMVRPHLEAKKDRNPIHKIFSYPAKFQGYLPKVLIENLTREGDLICDPYSGGGTTAATAAMLGRDCYAIDLNPIAVLSSRAKTKFFGQKQLEKEVQLLSSLRPAKINKLSAEEWLLIGPELGSFAEAIWSGIENKKFNLPELIGVLLIKRIKLACRRDKTHLRTAPFNNHIEYMIDEIYKAHNGFNIEKNFLGSTTIDHGSNHKLKLKPGSVDLIVTSPPYPNVDVEYNLIQLQRRDLNRCFRSDIGVRISSSVLGIQSKTSKKDLCDGGVAGSYWENLGNSLKEMNRVLKNDSMAFLYIGFKTNLDQKRFEKILAHCGFKIFDVFTVKLGKERVASSRGLFHGKDTSMMEVDKLFVLRKL